MGDFFVVYTDVIFLPRGISPLRSGYRPHFGRNDIIKPNEHIIISSDSREIPYNRKDNKHTLIIIKLPSVAETTVSASARFPRSLRSLGMTNYMGVRGG